jgi:hypothetical protein
VEPAATGHPEQAAAPPQVEGLAPDPTATEAAELHEQGGGRGLSRRGFIGGSAAATTAAALGAWALTRPHGAPSRPAPAAPDVHAGGTTLYQRRAGVWGAVDQVYNVREYGASGDGVSDDSRAIAAAITAAVAGGGGVVYFPPGTYITGTQTVNSRVHYWGAGIEATIIRLRSGAGADLFQGAGFHGLTGGNSVGGIFNWSMRDLTLDGNAAGQTSGFALRVYGYGYSLENLRIRNARQAGIWSEWATSADSPGHDAMEAHVVNLKVHDCQHGIEWIGPHDSTWVNCTVFHNRERGVWVRGAGSGLQATNTHVWGNGGVCWYLEAATMLFNCQGEGTGGDAGNPQVFVGANDCQIVGGSFYGSGTGKVGIAVGDAGHPDVAGLHVDTKILNCPRGAVALGSDGGINSITALTWGSPPVTGAAAASTRLRVMTPSNRGHLPPPAIPASASPFTNTCGVDATVHVSGGSVTGIAVHGAVTGLTAGSFRVPAGQTITLSYTAPPTWTWFGD